LETSHLKLQQPCDFTVKLSSLFTKFRGSAGLVFLLSSVSWLAVSSFIADERENGVD
jgi:hypothetical protein